MRVTHRIVALLVAALSGTVMVSCSRIHRDDPPAADQGPAARIRLGYFADVTHAAALIGLREGFLTRELGGTALDTQRFDSGPDETAALLGGSLDVAFIGPGPAIDAYTRSDGAAVRVVAGAASGGAQLVARPDVRTVADLRGATVASPQLGNTQDIALKTWAAQRHVTDMRVLNSADAQIATEFARGEIAAAWVPEPWASTLVLDDGGHVLVDERSLWPRNTFPTTLVVVRTLFLEQHRATVAAVLRAVVDADDWAHANPAGARTAVNAELASDTGVPLSDAVLRRAMADITLLTDPLRAALRVDAQHAVTAGVAERVPDLSGLVDTSTLDHVTHSAGSGS